MSIVLDFVLKECNLPVKGNEVVPFCESCQFGKAHSLPFSLSNSRANRPFDLIHSDLWGPALVNSTDGFRFYVLYLDDHSRFTWLYPLKRKSDTILAFKHFLRLVQTQFNSNIKAFQSDNGGEFTHVHQECYKYGIRSQYSCPYTSA